MRTHLHSGQQRQSAASNLSSKPLTCDDPRWLCEAEKYTPHGLSGEVCSAGTHFRSSTVLRGTHQKFHLCRSEAWAGVGLFYKSHTTTAHIPCRQVRLMHAHEHARLQRQPAVQGRAKAMGSEPRDAARDTQPAAQPTQTDPLEVSLVGAPQLMVTSPSHSTTTCSDRHHRTPARVLGGPNSHEQWPPAPQRTSTTPLHS